MTRILLYFLFGIGLPSGLLGYLAFRGIQNDRALLERERRNELERVVSELQTEIDSRLDELTRTVSELFQMAASAPGRASDLSALPRSSGAVEALFTVDAAGAVRVVASEGLRFRGEPTKAVHVPGSPGWATSFAYARERELRSGDLDAALDLYRDALLRASDEQARAETLIAIARVERKLGRPKEAEGSYARLRSEQADVELSGGMPVGAAAGLERAAALLEAHDSAAATHSLMDHQHELLEGGWLLTPAQFDFLFGDVMKSLERLAGTRAFPWPADTLRVIREVVRDRREQAMALLAFEDVAGRVLASSTSATDRVSVGAGGRVFHAILASPPRAGSAGEGFVVDLAALTSDVLTATLDTSGDRLAWTLRENAEALASSPETPDPTAPTVAAALAGFSPFTVELGYAPTTPTGFLTSRRAVYFYAFLLLAGILAFGLTLTIRSVGRELELARMKSDFVSTVSHELRSPLTAIRQVAEMLGDGRVQSEDRRRRYYAVLVEQSERLSRLVDDVLDFARMEAGKRRMQLEPIGVVGLVEEIVADARQRVAHRGFEIRSEIAPILPVLRLDVDAVRQALRNLIDNGVKYAGTSKELIVRSYCEKGDVVIAVQDFGVGIPPEDLGRVFERFYRGGQELTRTVNGTGLGLTLVKLIVEAHGGQVDVESAPGRGSTFSIRLPTHGALSADDLGVA